MWTIYLVTAVVILAITSMLQFFTINKDKKKEKTTQSELYRPKSSLPLLGNTLDVMFFHKHRLQDWMADQSRHTNGKPWLLQIIGRPLTYVFTSPEAIEDIFKTQFHNFPKGDAFYLTAFDLLGDGIIGVDGSKWFHQRKTASNLFSHQIMKTVMEQVVIEKSLQFRDVLARFARDNKPIDMKSFISKFTSDVFTKIGFGVDLKGLDDDTSEHPFIGAVGSMLGIFQARLQSPMWFWRLKRWLNIGDEAQLKKDMAVVHGLMHDIISRSMANKTTAKENQSSKGKDLMTLFLESRDDLDVATVRDTVLNFFLAGKDTTSFAISWFIVMLNRYPHVLAKIREEIQTQLPELWCREKQAPSMEDLSKLVYLEAALKENLRLNIATMHRVALEDTTLSDGTFVPKKAHCIVPMYAQGRVKALWGDDCDDFKPERWLDANGKLIHVSPFKFFAFVGGPRMCLGKRFAFLEMKTLMVVLLSQFDIKTVKDPFEITYDFSVVLPVKGPLIANITSILPAAY